MYLM